MELYQRVRDYDIAFNWDRTAEVTGILRIARRHARKPVSRVLEPASGPGRYSTAFARQGAAVMGYDLNPDMVALAEERAREDGVADRCRFLEGDMCDPPATGEHDAAANLVNSIGYLLTDEQIEAHFAATRAALRPGGVYVVQICFAWRDLKNARPAEWTGGEGDVRYLLRWQICAEDRVKKTSRQSCRVVVTERGEKRTLEEDHLLRLWLPDDLEALADRTGLAWVATYDGTFLPVNDRQRIVGETGNLYVLLQRRN